MGEHLDKALNTADLSGASSIGAPLTADKGAWGATTMTRQWQRSTDKTKWVPHPYGLIYHNRWFRNWWDRTWARIHCWFTNDYFYERDYDDESYTEDPELIGTPVMVAEPVMEDIPGATGETYDLTDADVGKSVGCKVTATSEPLEILELVRDYLGNGGLFNPECMEHEKVRDMVIRLRDELVEARHRANNAEREREDRIDLDVAKRTVMLNAQVAALRAELAKSNPPGTST